METRALILDAAIAAFEAGGEAGLSLRDVASRVGLTPMAVYRHFADRQDLIDAVVDHATRIWRQRVAAIEPAAPTDWLLSIGQAFLDFALECPRLWEAAFLTRSKAALRFPDDFRNGGSSAVSLQLALVEAIAPESGEPGKPSGMDMVIILVSLAHGLVALYRSGRFSTDEAGFRDLYAVALRTCALSFGLKGSP